MGSLSIWHWLIVLAIVVLVFGTGIVVEARVRRLAHQRASGARVGGLCVAVERDQHVSGRILHEGKVVGCNAGFPGCARAGDAVLLFDHC